MTLEVTGYHAAFRSGRHTRAVAYRVVAGGEAVPLDDAQWAE